MPAWTSSAGFDEYQYVVGAVKSGQVSIQRIDTSVRKLLRLKFIQGLFDNPYVDPGAAATTVGTAAAKAKALRAQAASSVLLKNDRALPLKPGKKVFLHNVSADVARAKGFTVVDNVQDANVALMRLSTPFETLHPNYFFGNRHHEGRLDFRPGNKDYDALLAATAAKVPVVASVYLDRPAILTNVARKTAALLGNFGQSDEAFFVNLTGAVAPQGKLPFQLPKSMATVENNDPGRAKDLRDPLYNYGFGLSY